jgi:hypothetical protein
MQSMSDLPSMIDDRALSVDPTHVEVDTMHMPTYSNIKIIDLQHGLPCGSMADISRAYRSDQSSAEMKVVTVESLMIPGERQDFADPKVNCR